jgi:hypothetical protein
MPRKLCEDMMAKLPLLDFHYQRHIDESKLGEIRDTLEECYPRLGRWLPEKVEVTIFETTAHSSAFLESEKAELGITTAGDDAFVCCHDAWRGYPRLLICLERLFALPTIARLGALRHEAAHTVLHGGLAYYLFRIPQDCLQMASDKGMDQKLLQQVLYYCATAVKDFEATSFLLKQGYEKCQLAFAATQFLPSDEDKFSWILAKTHPVGKLLFFACQLKPLLLAWPLETANLFKLEESAHRMLNYMELLVRKVLLACAEAIAKQLGEDTHNNVRLTLRKVLREFA